MIISNSHRFVFVHLHKTAGTAVTDAFVPTLAWNDIFLGSETVGNELEPYFRRRFGLHKHAAAWAIRRVIGDTLWRDYFIFSVVRNPYARAVSTYTWIRSIVEARRRLFWRQWLRRPWRRPSREYMRWPVTKAFLESRSFGEFVRNKHFREDQAGFTQFESLADEDNREIIVDFVAHQETLENDFAILCKRVGCPHLKLEWRNVSHRRSPWQSFYASSADRDFVYDLYKVDFETFGYSRELDREPDRAAMTAGRGRADLAS